jgi:hypothetical protein
VPNLAFLAVPYLAYSAVVKLAYFANIININMLWQKKTA